MNCSNRTPFWDRLEVLGGERVYRPAVRLFIRLRWNGAPSQDLLVITSLRAIGEGLHERGIPTARGVGNWSAIQVARVLARGPASLMPQRPFADLSVAA
jgi:hypothetical protein